MKKTVNDKTISFIQFMLNSETSEEGDFECQGLVQIGTGDPFYHLQ